MAVVALYASGALTPHQTAGCLFISAACMYLMHLARLRSARLQSMLLVHFGALIRPHELRRPPGALWLLLGMGLVITLWGRDDTNSRIDGCSSTAIVDVAALSMVSASIGDPLASVVGQRLGGRARWRVGRERKSVEAAAVAALGSAIVCYVVLVLQHSAFGSLSASSACVTAPLAASTWNGAACDVQLAMVDAHLLVWSLLAGVLGAGVELVECSWPQCLLTVASSVAATVAPGAARVEQGDEEEKDEEGRARSIDDNLRVPVVTALLLSLLRTCLPFYAAVSAEARCYT
jgi:dolichol kinase